MEKRKLRLEKRSVKFLRKLPPKQQMQVARSLQILEENVRPQDSKKLKDIDRWRIDIGEYRAVYWWDEVFVQVVLIGKRNDGEVYRKLDRL